MALANNLKEARINKGLKQEELAKLIGKSKNVISNWERGDNKPDADTLFELCDILDVDANFLLGWESNQNLSLSINEQNHIKKYRSLRNKSKKAIDDMIDLFVELEQEQRMEIAEESAPYMYAKTEYLTGLSAGTGLFVFDDIPTQVIEVPEIYKNADFVIGVTGDSMEPRYFNGEKVAVQKVSTINIGDIGVFMHEGNGYIKEFGNNKLVSLNKAYPDIDINETTVCIGKVLGKL